MDCRCSGCSAAIPTSSGLLPCHQALSDTSGNRYWGLQQELACESPWGEKAADTGHAGHQLRRALGWAAKPVLKPDPQPKSSTEKGRTHGGQAHLGVCEQSSSLGSVDADLKTCPWGSRVCLLPPWAAVLTSGSPVLLPQPFVMNFLFTSMNKFTFLKIPAL